MSHHDYREEPNLRFSPDNTMVFFTSNLSGASYAFEVVVKKAENPAAADVKDAAELGEIKHTQMLLSLQHSSTPAQFASNRTTPIGLQEACLPRRPLLPRH